MATPTREELINKAKELAGELGITDSKKVDEFVKNRQEIARTKTMTPEDSMEWLEGDIKGVKDFKVEAGKLADARKIAPAEKTKFINEALEAAKEDTSKGTITWLEAIKKLEKYKPGGATPAAPKSFWDKLGTGYKTGGVFGALMAGVEAAADGVGVGGDTLKTLKGFLGDTFGNAKDFIGNNMMGMAGAAAGFMMAGPIGALLGFFIGSMLDAKGVVAGWMGLNKENAPGGSLLSKEGQQKAKATGKEIAAALVTKEPGKNPGKDAADLLRKFDTEVLGTEIDKLRESKDPREHLKANILDKERATNERAAGLLEKEGIKQLLAAKPKGSGGKTIGEMLETGSDQDKQNAIKWIVQQEIREDNKARAMAAKKASIAEDAKRGTEDGHKRIGFGASAHHSDGDTVAAKAAADKIRAKIKAAKITATEDEIKGVIEVVAPVITMIADPPYTTVGLTVG